MNKKELLIQRKKVWHSYHVPGMGNYTTRPINAIFLSPANSWKHEKEKCHQCYLLLKKKMKFITEAVENSTNLRRDLVILDTGEVIEIETTKKRAARFKDQDVTVIMV